MTNQVDHSVSAQAPAMVAITSQVGEPQEFHQAAVLSLKVAVSRYDIAVIHARQDQEVLVSFEDATQTVIDYEDIPHDDLAVVFRAVDTLRQHLSRSKKTSGLDITIKKHIPFETHLGGTAASAAAILVALAGLWDASLVREDLARIARGVGPGVAEAITGGVVITSVDADEELVTPVLTQAEIALVLVPAAADLEDNEMFQTLHQLRNAHDDMSGRSHLELDPELVQSITNGDAKQLALMMHNDFQPALVHTLPEHNDWLTAGMDDGALAAQTVDRGPSLVFVAQDFSAATELAERFEQRMEISAVAERGPVQGAYLI